MVELVEAAEFFHINRGPNSTRSKPLLNVGDVVEAGNESNPFFHYFEAHHRAYPVTSNRDGTTSHHSAIAFLNGLGTGEFKVPDQDLSTAVQLGHETAKHFMLLAREMLWELTRIEGNSEAPSRHLRIPRQSGHRFRCNAGSHSD